MIAIGVLPYPFTFLCTDLISELYGRKKANQVVWMGLILNGSSFCLDIWGVRSAEVLIDGLPKVFSNGDQIFIPQEYAFYQIRKLTMGATVASMVAYLSANLLMYTFFTF